MTRPRRQAAAAVSPRRWHQGSPRRALWSLPGAFLAGKLVIVPSVRVSYLIQASFSRAVAGVEDRAEGGQVLVGLLGSLFRGPLGLKQVARRGLVPWQEDEQGVFSVFGRGLEMAMVGGEVVVRG